MATTTSTTDSSNYLPDWAKPYFERNLARAEAEYAKPYVEYTGQRIADTDPNIVAARERTLGIAGSGIAGLPQAQDYTQEGMDLARGLGDYDPTQFTAFDYTQPDMFTGDAVGQYMSPYMQNVVDVQKQQAMLDFDRMQGKRDFGAVQAGAFGGSRRGVADYLAQEGLARDLATIQATGQQKAYEDASKQFGLDRTALMDDEARRATELGRVQTDTEAANQFGATQGLAALDTGRALAGDLTTYGELGRQTDIQNAQLLEGLGIAQTAEDQARLDMDYGNFLNQQGFGRQQISDMTGVLAGQPIAATGNATSTTVGTVPEPSNFQKLMGAGLSGVSLYNAFSGMF